MVKVFKANKVEVVTLTPAEYDQWVKVASKARTRSSPRKSRTAGSSSTRR